MKQIIFLLCLISISVASFAQGYTKPRSNTYEVYSQMWNTSNTYYSTPTAANLGTQKDTSGAATVYLYTAALQSNGTFSVSAVPDGSGTISFTAAVWKGQKVTTTVNPLVVITPQASFDGIIFATIPGVTAASLTPTSGVYANMLTTKFDYTAKQGNFFRMKLVITVDTAAFQSWFDFQRIYNLSSR